MKKVLIGLAIVLSFVNYSCSELGVDPDQGTSKSSKTVAVDLGLPSGVKWATCNLGASSPEQHGDYYAWGETTPYYSSQSPLSWKEGKTDGYDWTSYKWCQGSEQTLTKYNQYESCGIIDNKTVLDPADDVAHIKLGGKWRIPTREEWGELLKYCNGTRTTQNGLQGILVTSQINGNSIFLPAAGIRNGTSLYDTGSFGNYWSANTWHSSLAYRVYFDSRYDYIRCYIDDCSRCSGLSVRPVCD